MSERILHTILFSTGSARNVDADEAEIRKLAEVDFEGISIFPGKGYWKGQEEELAFQLLIATQDDRAVDSLIERIKTAFSQDSVVHIRHSSASVTFHGNTQRLNARRRHVELEITKLGYGTSGKAPT